MQAPSRPNAPQPPSLIKWTGSKRSQAAEIRSHFPEHSRYVEPFLGGGALLYHAEAPVSLANDLYAPLVGFWRLVKSDPERVAADYREQWTRLQANLPDYFYEVRERFNAAGDPLDLAFLSRTCVNGIIRFNAKGEFNNSFHLSRKGMGPDRFAKVVRRWHARLGNASFQNVDYKEILEGARAGDLIYLDPPYANNKQRYASDIDMDELCLELEKLNAKGVKWAMSLDGSRGGKSYSAPIPPALFTRRILIESGLSAVKKVLSGQRENVLESLYVNY